MEFVDYCGICGIALKQFEVSGVLSGSYINFEERRSGSLEITMCVDCQNKVLENVMGDMGAAVNKRLAIEDQVKIPPHKKKYRKKDDDDGSGGEIRVVPPA